MKVSYVEKDVDDNSIREEMNAKTNNNQTIPVLFIGNEYWVNPSIAILQDKFSKKYRRNLCMTLL
jgi:glutaredoxin